VPIGELTVPTNANEPDGFDDGVAGEFDAFRRDAFGEQVVPRQWCGRAAEIGEVVDEDTVVLFGHCAVEAAQTGFEMHEWRAGSVGCQAPASAEVVSPCTSTASG